MEPTQSYHAVPNPILLQFIQPPSGGIQPSLPRYTPLCLVQTSAALFETTERLRKRQCSVSQAKPLDQIIRKGNGVDPGLLYFGCARLACIPRCGYKSISALQRGPDQVQAGVMNQQLSQHLDRQDGLLNVGSILTGATSYKVHGQAPRDNINVLNNRVNPQSLLQNLTWHQPRPRT